MEIEWSERAVTDIRNLRAYIWKDSPYYAEQFVGRIVASVERLAEFPELGRVVPEAGDRDDVRELLYRGYRIIYLLRSDKVSIVTVVHGRRDLTSGADAPWDLG